MITTGKEKDMQGEYTEIDGLDGIYGVLDALRHITIRRGGGPHVLPDRHVVEIVSREEAKRRGMERDLQVTIVTETDEENGSETVEMRYEAVAAGKFLSEEFRRKEKK